MGLTAYLVRGHSKRVDIALLRRGAVFEAKQRWVQQLRSHVTGTCSCKAVSPHDGGVGNEPCDPKISEARVTLLGDQDVFLNRSSSVTRPPRITPISPE